MSSLKMMNRGEGCERKRFKKRTGREQRGVRRRRDMGIR